MNNVSIIFNDKNIGLAGGQNQGLKECMKSDINWLLLLDDDSEIEENYVNELVKKLKKIENNKNIGMIGSNILYKHNNKISRYPVKSYFFIIRKKIEDIKEKDEIMCIMASGSIINMEAIKKIGEFKESFFIDHIDIEYCLRMKVNNYKIIVDKNLKLYQRVGNTVEKVFLGVKVYPTNHNSGRQYTKFKNAVLTWKKYFFKETKFVIYDMLLMLHHLLRIIIFESPKGEKLKNIAKGIKDGIIEN